jgi:hypothetical protein
VDLVDLQLAALSAGLPLDWRNPVPGFLSAGLPLGLEEPTSAADVGGQAAQPRLCHLCLLGSRLTLAAGCPMALPRSGLNIKHPLISKSVCRCISIAILLGDQ